MSDQEKAVSSASKWALRHFMLPIEFKACIQGIEEETQFFSKVRWYIRKRQIVIKQEPFKGKAEREEPIAPDTFDPWAENNIGLREKTSQITTCETCNGEKKVTCPSCKGSTHIACPGCHGSGTDISPKTGNVINCRKCKGSGQKKCKCKTGLTKCLICDGKGKAKRWLEVEESILKRVDNSQPNLFANILGPYVSCDSFCEDTSGFALKPLFKWSGTDPHLIPSNIQAQLSDQPMRPIESAKEERVEKVDVQVFSLSFFHIHYQMAWKKGQVSVSTDRFQVVADDESLKPLKLSRGILATIGVISLISGFLTVGAYNAQHLYYGTTLNSTLLTWLAFLFPVVALPPTTLLLLPNFGRFKTYFKTTLGIATAFVLLVTFLFFTGGPSVARAFAYHREGKLVLAMQEAKACLDLRRDVTKAKKAHDLILLAQTTGKPKEIFASMSKRFFSQEYKIKAENQAFGLITKKLNKLHQRGSYDLTEPWLRRFPQRLRSHQRSKSLLLDANIKLAIQYAKRHRPNVAFARLTKVPNAHHSRNDFRYALSQTYLSYAHRCAIKCQQNCFFENIKKAKGIGFGQQDLNRIIEQIKAHLLKRLKGIYSQKNEESCISFTKLIAATYGVKSSQILKGLYLLRARRCVDQFDLRCLKSALNHATATKKLLLRDLSALKRYAVSRVIASIRQRGRKLRPGFTLEDAAQACNDLQGAKAFLFRLNVKKGLWYRWVVDFDRYCQKVQQDWRAFRRRGLYYTTSSVRCNDGFYSSCSCNRLRGCCSHHGGVRRCEYTRHKKVVPASSIHKLWHK